MQHRIWFNWSLPLIVQVPLALLWGIATRHAVVESGRSRIRWILGKFVSEDVAAMAVEQGFQIKLGGEKRVATMMFTDLENFAGFSQAIPPEKLARVLSSYFERTNPYIQGSGGAILRYVGDAIVAVWNAPLDCADHAKRACAAAREIARLNEEPLVVDGEEFRLRTRIGVHTGSVIACNVGSEDRFDFTVLGDDVNLAARLEGLNKYFHTTALTTRSSIMLLGGATAVRCLGSIVVKGRNKGVRVFELLDEPIDPAWQHRFMQAVVLFAKSNIAAANTAFLALKQDCPDDGSVDFHLSRIKAGKTSWPIEMDEK